MSRASSRGVQDGQTYIEAELSAATLLFLLFLDLLLDRRLLLDWVQVRHVGLRRRHFFLLPVVLFHVEEGVRLSRTSMFETCAAHIPGSRPRHLHLRTFVVQMRVWEEQPWAQAPRERLRPSLRLLHVSEPLLDALFLLKGSKTHPSRSLCNVCLCVCVRGKHGSR